MWQRAPRDSCTLYENYISFNLFWICHFTISLKAPFFLYFENWWTDVPKVALSIFKDCTSLPYKGFSYSSQCPLSPIRLCALLFSDYSQMRRGAHRVLVMITREGGTYPVMLVRDKSTSGGQGKMPAIFSLLFEVQVVVENRKKLWKKSRAGISWSESLDES